MPILDECLDTRDYLLFVSCSFFRLGAHRDQLGLIIIAMEISRRAISPRDTVYHLLKYMIPP